MDGGAATCLGPAPSNLYAYEYHPPPGAGTHTILAKVLNAAGSDASAPVTVFTVSTG